MHFKQDLRGVYDVKNHPKYLNGEETEEELYIKFLKKFETNGLSGKNEKETVGDGKVNCIDIEDILINYPPETGFTVSISGYK